jgi:hypothetical protein
MLANRLVEEEETSGQVEQSTQNLAWLLMESRVVKRIEKFYRQDAKFTERKEERSREKLPGNPRFSLWTLCDLGVLAVKSPRLGENRLTTLDSIKSLAFFVQVRSDLARIYRSVVSLSPT